MTAKTAAMLADMTGNEIEKAIHLAMKLRGEHSKQGCLTTCTECAVKCIVYTTGDSQDK